MRKKIAQLLLISLGLLIGGVTSIAVAQGPRDTLHDRAKKAGGKLVWRYRATRSLVYPNIEEMAKRSDLIVVGRTLAHRPSLRSDGKFLTKDFLVRVQDVIKGDGTLGQSIIISVPGGAYRFPDGTYVALLPANFKGAEDGRTYVFFLKAKGKDSAYKGHTLISETQGLYELKDGIVDPADYVASDPVVTKYRGVQTAKFLSQVRTAVPRRKNN